MSVETIDADLKTLATIKFGKDSFTLTELAFEDIEKINEAEDQQVAVFDLIAKAGIPKRVSKKLSIGVIKRIEGLLVGELKTEKK